MFTFWDVVRTAHVHRDAVVRRDAERRGLAAAQADFLLRREDEIQVVYIFLQHLHGHQQHDAAAAVVSVAAGDAVAAQHGASRVVYAHIAGTDAFFRFLFRSGANIYVQLFQRNFTLIFDVVAMDNAFSAVLETYRRSEDFFFENRANFSKAQLAIFFNVGHHHANGIHVCREHDLLAGTLLVADQIAHHVGPDLIAVGFRHLRDDRGDLFLAAAGPEGCIQCIQSF